MKWTKVALETTTEAVDMVSNMLSELGIMGIEIKDNIPITEEEKQLMFIDILPELDEDDGSAIIYFYIDTKEKTEDLLLKVRDELIKLSEFVDVGSRNIKVSQTEDKDWINNWKQYFKSFRIDDTIVIKPTWEKVTEHKDSDLIIEIDPGMSFGTGAHETTRLSIAGLKKYCLPDSVILDVGSGSGILSIIAKKLGAKEVIGIDIDPRATDSAIENAAVNHLPVMQGELSFVTGNILEDAGLLIRMGKEKYDIVVANILADVIIPLSDVIRVNLKKGGIFISSGIIDTKEDLVKEVLLKNDFTFLEVNRMGEWVSFIAKSNYIM
jgi:ribosomal protein L11 methyltransferase